MVDRITGLISRRWESIHQAALVLGISAIASQLLALLRDRIFAHNFGASLTLDIYYASFRVPDLLFTTIASFVSITILIPFVSNLMVKGDNEKARRFMSSVLSLFMIVMLVVSVLVFFLLPYFSKWLAPGFDAASQSQFILVSRILLVQPILLGIANLYATIIQSMRVFFVYALTPIMYNIGIIIGALLFYPAIGITGLAWGVLLGALLQVLVQIPILQKNKLLPVPKFSVDFREIGGVIKTAIPRTITLGVHQIVLLILTAMASLMAVGSISVFNYSLNLQSVPLSIIGMSYSVAAFPALASLYSRGRIESFVETISAAARHIIFWALPVSALFIVLRAQVVRSVLGTGAFDWTSTRLVAAALAIFVVSIFAQSLVLLFVRGYYAAGDTLKPLMVNVSSSILMILFALILIPLFAISAPLRFFIESLFRVSGIPGTIVLVLPLSFSLGMLINVGLFYLLFKRDFPEFKTNLSVTVRHALYSAVTMGSVAYVCLSIFDNVFNLETFFGIFLQGLFSGLIAIFAGILLLRLIKNREIADIHESFKSRFVK